MKIMRPWGAARWVCCALAVLLGQDAALAATRDASGLTVELPAPKPEEARAPFVLKIALGR